MTIEDPKFVSFQWVEYIPPPPPKSRWERFWDEKVTGENLVPLLISILWGLFFLLTVLK